jgi:hypothetical protein
MMRDDWLLPFLACVRRRPGMFLGAQDVHTLATFIAAYSLSRQHQGLSSGTGLIDEFESWLLIRHDQVTTNLGWQGCIRTLDPSADNIFTFYRELEVFLAERGLALTQEMAEEWSRALLAAG